MKIKRRDYLSWSQLNTWEKNPNLYYEMYVLNLEAPFTKWMKKGKDLAEYLEYLDWLESKNKQLKKYADKSNYKDEEWDIDEDIKQVADFIPRYKHSEFEMKVKLENINLLGYFDSFDDDTLDLYEYKTGKKYTQAMANKLGQIDFYALMIWLKYKKLPNSIKLIWIETETIDDEVKFTGKIKTFEVKKTMKDIIKIIGRIHKAKKGIDDMWKTVDK